MSDMAPFEQALIKAMVVDPRSAWEIIQAQRQTIKTMRAVVDAAIAETMAEDSPITQRELDPFREARRHAVAEHNQHENPK